MQKTAKDKSKGMAQTFIVSLDCPLRGTLILIFDPVKSMGNLKANDTPSGVLPCSVCPGSAPGGTFTRSSCTVPSTLWLAASTAVMASSSRA
jgi:hypothetical protein